jgi:hypothetical protein
LHSVAAPLRAGLIQALGIFWSFKVSQEELKAQVAKEALRICNMRMTTDTSPVPEAMMQSIQSQLAWLIEFFEGRSTERNKLHALTFGHYAAREIEDSDPEFAAALHKACYVANRTGSGLKIDPTVIGADA